MKLIKNWWTNEAVQYWLKFVGKTIFFFAVVVMLVYLYHYKNIQGGTFIYNEF